MKQQTQQKKGGQIPTAPPSNHFLICNTSNNIINSLTRILWFIVSASLIIFLVAIFIIPYSNKISLNNISIESTLIFIRPSTSTPPPLPQPQTAAPVPFENSTPPSQTPVSAPSTSKPPRPFFVLNHNLSDEELMQRASMAPKNVNREDGVVPKIAFMFLTRGPLPLSPFWEMFFKGYQGLYNIYVHSEPYDKTTFPVTSVFYGRQIPSKIHAVARPFTYIPFFTEVQWGDFNLVEAERRLLANALLNDTTNQRFILLSESCIPLFNFPTIYSYLINSTKSFIEAYYLRSPVGTGRYNHKMVPLVKLSQWRKGSQWFELDRGLAHEIVSDKRYFDCFKNYCKAPCYGDEHYLPTFVSIEYWKRNSNRTVTWVDWSKGGAHPVTYNRNQVTWDFLKRLRNKKDCEYNGKKGKVCYLFARKFAVDSLCRLVRFGPKLMKFK